MQFTALLLVKTLSEAKQRLAEHFTPTQRAELMFHMFTHVLTTLIKSQTFERIAVVSADQRVQQYTQQLGAHYYQEPYALGQNLSATIAAIKERERGAQALLTIVADLPLIQISDILQMVKQAQEAPLVFAPDSQASRTNAMIVSPPLAIPYLFGPDSFHRYCQEAILYRLLARIVSSTGLAVDIDTLQDYRSYQEAFQRHTSRFPHQEVASLNPDLQTRGHLLLFITSRQVEQR